MMFGLRLTAHYWTSTTSKANYRGSHYTAIIAQEKSLLLCWRDTLTSIFSFCHGKNWYNLGLACIQNVPRMNIGWFVTAILRRTNTYWLWKKHEQRKRTQSLSSIIISDKLINLCDQHILVDRCVMHRQRRLILNKMLRFWGAHLREGSIKQKLAT